jgi:hypothetical protein
MELDRISLRLLLPRSKITVLSPNLFFRDLPNILINLQQQLIFMSSDYSQNFNLNSSQGEQLGRILYLETCLRLPARDRQVERVLKEVAELFSSQELQQRLQQKGIRIK